ncbi:MAG TPA: hypothetical protein VIZ28_04820 [Chitinophagaceae bacterium]
MNESIYLQNPTPQQQPCSEQKCITCFENRGCMYDTYLLVEKGNVEVIHLPKQDEDGNSSKFIS